MVPKKSTEPAGRSQQTAKRKAFLLRVPEELIDELREWADTELRSMNAQVELVLREALSQRD